MGNIRDSKMIPRMNDSVDSVQKEIKLINGKFSRRDGHPSK